VRVLNYLELADRLERSGIATAARQQREALADTEVEVTTTPWTGPGLADTLVSGVTGQGVVREFDVAHLHLFGPGSLAVLAHARRNDVPLVLHAHTLRENTVGSWRGSHFVAGPLERFLRWFYSQADLVLCPTEWAAERLRAYPVDVPMRAVTNGVDTDALEGHEALREEHRDRFDLEGMVVFMVGNVFERKGLTTFCRLAETTDYDFVWFGPYDRGPHASSAVREWTANPPETLQFTGWIDDVRGAYGAGDVFCFPTRNETQGLAALEAMACGKAVVVRDIPVFEELYTHEVDCLKCDSLEEFRDALDRLATNPDLRERLGENATETAAEHGLDRVAEELIDAYEFVTG